MRPFLLDCHGLLYFRTNTARTESRETVPPIPQLHVLGGWPKLATGPADRNIACSDADL